jgi:MraZ protein
MRSIHGGTQEVTRKTQIGWLAAGAALGFVSVVLGPKLLDRLHSQASTESKPEKSATAFDQVAQVWAKPKGGNEEQEPLPKSDGNLKQPPILIPPSPAFPFKKELASQETKQVENVPPAQEVPAANLAPDVPPANQEKVATEPNDPPPQDKVDAEPLEKPSTRLRAADRQLVEPPPAPPKTDEVKSLPPDLPKDTALPPQPDLASPPPVPENRQTPRPQPAVKQTAPEPQPSSTIPPPEVRPPADDDVALPAISRASPDTPAATQPLAPVATISRTQPTIRKTPAVAKAKSLPLTGMHPCMLDDRKGLVLPKSLREQMGESDVVFLTPGADQSLWLTTAASLEKLTDKMEKKTEGEDDGKLSRRHYFALTQRVAVDKAGRFVLPPALAAGADLKQEVVLIGVGDHVEVWDAQRWQKYCQGDGE